MIETLFEEGERTHAVGTKLLKVINLSIKVIGHDCRFKTENHERTKFNQNGSCRERVT